jgi:hypothetical protein
VTAEKSWGRWQAGKPDEIAGHHYDIVDELDVHIAEKNWHT